MTSSAGTTNLTYDFESRVTQISGPGINATYSYNGLDTRVGKTEKSVSNTFRRSGAYVTDPVLDDGTASYTPGVSRRQGTSVSYQHGGLKNLDAQTSVSQSVTAARVYDAFGNVVTSTGAWAGPFGYAGNFGYQQDASGLKLLGHRYYDPSTGRFLTRDPIKDGRNWYAYGAGQGSVTTGVDPDGLMMTSASVILGSQYSAPIPSRDLEDPMTVYRQSVGGTMVETTLTKPLPAGAGATAGAGMTAAGGAQALGKGLHAIGGIKARHLYALEGDFEKAG